MEMQCHLANTIESSTRCLIALLRYSRYVMQGESRDQPVVGVQISVLVKPESNHEML